MRPGIDSNRGTAGAIAVIVGTGAAAVRELGFFHGSLRDALVGASILAGVAALSWVVSRYIAAHSADIGEARFDTRNTRDLDPKA